MILVGGGAVQFHGYPRNSLDVDFWIDTSSENFERLLKVFNDMGYDIHGFPQKVLDKEQNISIKFAPMDLNLELITNFSVNKSFDEAYASAIEFSFDNDINSKSKVLTFDDLIISKVKAGRPKDLLDIQELNRVKQRVITKSQDYNPELNNKAIIDMALKFHRENNYKGKIPNIRAFYPDSALLIAIKDKFGIVLTESQLIEINKIVEQQRGQGKGFSM
jgi:hypothetical protein